jgi:hypothetical protein
MQFLQKWRTPPLALHNETGETSMRSLILASAFLAATAVSTTVLAPVQALE